MNLFFLLIAVGVAVVAGYYAYRWWRGPASPAPTLAQQGAYLVRSDALYGGYPTPLIYKQRAADQYIFALFDPQGKEAVAQLTERELQIMFDSHKEKYDVSEGDPVTLGATYGSRFTDAIRKHQAQALLALSASDPTDMAARAKEIESLARQPQDIIADLIRSMRDQLAP
jgi:hypothetical protein